MSYWRTCPRCNDSCYEVLRTHAYCVSCNYSPDLVDRPMSTDDLPIPTWTKKTGEIKKPSNEIESAADGAA